MPDWRSCFWHPSLKVLLVVYVDDFMVVAERAKAWEHYKRLAKLCSFSQKSQDKPELAYYIGIARLELQCKEKNTRMFLLHQKDYARMLVQRYQEELQFSIY